VVALAKESTVKVLPEDSKTEGSAKRNKGEPKENKKAETKNNLWKLNDNFDMRPTPEAESFRGSGREENLKRGLTRRFLFPKKHSKISQGRSPGSGHHDP
jgi:hypothetical protein